jgi:hypothetical protein
MGTFLSLNAVIGKSSAVVTDSLRNYARTAGGGLEQQAYNGTADGACVIASANGNTTILFPDGYTDWENCAAFISEELQAPVLFLHIHDGDFWMYVLYDKGILTDRFNPEPDYWEEDMSDADLNAWRGDVLKLLPYFPQLRAADMDRYLVRWQEDAEDETYAYPSDAYAQEAWQLTDFMAKLGIPYPVDDDAMPTGQTFRLWTRTFQPEPPKPVAATVQQDKKPWWKFW